MGRGLSQRIPNTKYSFFLGFNLGLRELRSIFCNFRTKPVAYEDSGNK